MSESNPNLRDELLKQNGASPPPVDADLKTLNQWIEEDRKGARRLMRWTIAVWVAWLVCLVLCFAIYFASYADPPKHASATNPTTSAPMQHSSGGAIEAIAGIVGFVAFLGIPFLPIIGIVLLIAALLRRRWANLSQIKQSLASIEAQLKTLKEGK
jgi:hypothetical protein